jgi:Bacterial Ig domain
MAREVLPTKFSVRTRLQFKKLSLILGSPVVWAFPLVLVSGEADAIDIGIENDAEYAQLVSAMRATEYVRTDVIVADNPKPRVYATLAGVMAYAERNPNATDAQLAAFVQAFDAACQAFTPGAPDLNNPARFYATLRFLTIDDPIFTGTDTKVGEQALKLLGITIPDPDGYESIQRRMVRYEFALARSLDYRPELFDLLVTGFFGQDPAGNDRPGLPAILDAYFEAEGFDPELGGVRDDRPKVNAGLAVLPTDFAGYELAIAEGPENMALRDVVTAQLDTVRAQITSIVGVDSTIDDGSLDFALANAPGLAESVDLTLNDPAYVQMVLDDLRADLEATTEARASSSAATYLMLQSDFAEIQTYASYTQDFSSISLQANDDLSGIKSGVTIAGNIGLLAGAYAVGDPLTAAGAILNLTTEAIGIVDGLNDGPPVDQQIFDQVVALRQQVEQMRQEMNERFDRIDRQLNIMYNTMIAGFDAIGDQIGDLQSDVDELVRDMAVARSQLRRLEAALYGVAQDILLTDLTSETNLVLDYRDENGIDLLYSGGSPDFITASESFFTYATVTSLSESFAGSRTNPTVNVDNADEYIGSAPVAAYINDLAVLPQSLGLPALANSILPGIEPWSQAASAYAQLARENPWYFAYRYRKQLEDYNSDPQNESLPELDRIIQSGDQLVSFVNTIRETDSNGDSALFDQLIMNYKGAVASVQTPIDTEIASRIPSLFTNGNVSLDFWQGTPQTSVQELVPRLIGTDGTQFQGSSFSLTFPNNAPDKGYKAFSAPGLSSVTQMSYLIENDLAGFPVKNEAVILIDELQTVNDWLVSMFLRVGNQKLENTEKAIKVYFEVGGSPIPNTPPFWSLYGMGPFGNGPYSRVQIFREAWADAGLGADWMNQNSTGSPLGTYEIGPIVVNSFPDTEEWYYRVIVTESIPATGFVPEDIFGDLYNYRSDIPPEILSQLLDESSLLSLAAQDLDDAKALIDAYVSIGMQEELNQSEVLRSALRAVPGTSELGLGFIDTILMVTDIDSTDSPNGWADQDLNISILGDVLNQRIDLVADEIRRGLERPASAPTYVGWMMAELNHLRETAFDLTADDTYVAGTDGVASADNLAGVLANDVDQEFRSISVDTAYILDPGYIAPANGSVTLNADGSFTYVADPGFIGTDSFTYRSMTMIDNVPDPVYSNPATVVITITENSGGACGPADLNSDGVLNFFDVSAFLAAFSNQDPVADFTGEGVFNFFDVSAFLQAFSAGCP